MEFTFFLSFFFYLICGGRLAWGGFPGVGSQSNIGSGDAKVHNTMLYDNVQKSVLRGPWRYHPHPFWLVSNRNSEEVARGSLKFFANPTLGGILPLGGLALKG